MSTNNGVKILSINHSIISGPESGLLWDAAKYAFKKNIPDLVFFEIKNPFPELIPDETVKIWVKILGIEHEDGSGKSFNIHGYVSKACPIGRYASRRFFAYYNAGSPRHGELRIKIDNN